MSVESKKGSRLAPLLSTGDRVRTCDLRIWNPWLCQLSYPRSTVEISIRAGGEGQGKSTHLISTPPTHVSSLHLKDRVNLYWGVQGEARDPYRGAGVPTSLAKHLAEEL